MSDNLFNERFWSYRQPAWHGFGYISDTPMGAQEAFSTMTPYSVSLESLVTASGNLTSYRAIVRDPVPDDPQPVIFGIVGGSYVLVEPQRFCEIYDDTIGQPIETLGALGKGEKLFLSTKLPSWSVRGDDLDNYLITLCPYDGVSAILVFISHVRPVCQNTVRLARQQSTEVYRIIHGTNVEQYLETWMAGLYQRALSRSEHIQLALETLANLQIQNIQVPRIIDEIYPIPPEPMKNAPPEIMEKREAEWEWVRKSVLRSRDAVQALFSGLGTGLDTPATKGTAYGLFQAVAEWENYRPTSNEESRGANILFGDRGRQIERAYSILEKGGLK